VNKGTIHTASGWKTDGKYGLYRRTDAGTEGTKAGWEVLLEADETEEERDEHQHQGVK